MSKQEGSYIEEQKEESISSSAIGDLATSKDYLGFEPYVDAITEFLTNDSTKPPVTLSIEGPWGCGKSSFMMQLKKKLDEKKECTITFNAWRHDKEDSLCACFALEVLSQLSKKLPSKKQRITSNLELFRSRFSWKKGGADILRIITVIVILLLFISYLHTNKIALFTSSPDHLKILIYLSGVLAAFNVILSPLMDFKKIIGNPFDINLKECLIAPNYEDYTIFIEKFHEDLSRILDFFAKTNKVFVFIDDLDRCEIPKAAELMQALNLMISNDTRLIFILGMDREKIAAGLAVKNESLLPYLSTRSTRENSKDKNINSYKAIEYGYEFIEKFIQLPFLVPQPDEPDLRRFLNEIAKKKYDELGLQSSESRLSNNPSMPISDLSENQGTIKKDAKNIFSKTNKEKEKKIFEKIKIAVETDSPTVHSIALMVSPALDNNPRRIIQFINLFRLKTFIASETGLFSSTDRNASLEDLTLEKLGKFVAITLRWPLIVSDLSFNINLLKELQEISLDNSYNIENVRDETKYWISQEKLLDLLRYGCLNNDGSKNAEGERIFSLSNLNIIKLLKTSPKFDRTSIFPISGMKAQAFEIDFQTASDKKQAWADLRNLSNDQNRDIRSRVIIAIRKNFEDLPDKQEACELLHRLAIDEDSTVRSNVAKALGTIFYDIPDKNKAWIDLHKLTLDKSSTVRRIVAKVLASIYRNVPDKKQLLEDLHRLTSDEVSNVRNKAYNSLGRISIYKASQAETEEEYINNFKQAVNFFEKSSNEVTFSDPSKFCYPFYSSLYTIIVSNQKQTAENEISKYLIEAKKAVGKSENKKLLFEAVENLANALKEIQNLKNLDLEAKKNELEVYRKYCEQAAELMKNTEETAPAATKVMRMGSRILDRKLKSLLEEIQEKAKTAVQVSKGTATEEIASAVNQEIQKWEIGDSDEIERKLADLIFILKSKIPNTPENKETLDLIESIRHETDIVKQYRIVTTIIGLIPTINVVPSESFVKDFKDHKRMNIRTEEKGEKISNFKTYMEPTSNEELVLHIGPMGSYGGVEYTLTIPLKGLLSSEIEGDLSEISERKINKLSELPKNIAEIVKDYLIKNNMEDLLKRLY